MLDLAPGITRQRLVVEGLCREAIDPGTIRDYLSKLSETIQMTTLTEPVTHKSPLYGWAGWIHWETSGAHFYAWDGPQVFFSVDIYACKAFVTDDVVTFTREFFGADDVVWKDF